MDKCQVCGNEFDLDNLQWVSGPLPEGAHWTELLKETLMCNDCLKAHLDKVWKDLG